MTPTQRQSETSMQIVRLAETNIAVAYSPKKGTLRVSRIDLNGDDPDWNKASLFWIVYDESAKEWIEFSIILWKPT